MTLQRFLLITAVSILVPTGSALALTEAQFNSPDMLAQRSSPNRPDFDHDDYEERREDYEERREDFEDCFDEDDGDDRRECFEDLQDDRDNHPERRSGQSGRRAGPDAGQFEPTRR